MGAIVAQYTESVIAAPQQIAVLAETPLDVEQANWRVLDGRMASAINASRPTNKIEGWAAYDYANPDYSSGFMDGSANLNTVSIGGDMLLSSRLLFGLQFGYTQDKGNLGAGDYKLNDYMGTMYLGYGEDNWYVGATLGAGSLDYTNITRTIQLGAQTRTETGSANGYQTVARVLGGYWFQVRQQLGARPVGEIHLRRRRRPFVPGKRRVEYDDGVRPTGAQAVPDEPRLAGLGQCQRHPSVRPRVVGIRLEGGRAQCLGERRRNGRKLLAARLPARTTAGRCSISARAPTSARSPVSLYGAATAGKSSGDYWAVTLGLRVPL